LSFIARPSTCDRSGPHPHLFKVEKSLQLNVKTALILKMLQYSQHTAFFYFFLHGFTLIYTFEVGNIVGNYGY